MTFVVLIAWIAMSALFVKRGCSDECIYIGSSMMLAAQYVRASMMDKRKAKMDGGADDAAD